jgi:hypothetical protein
MISEGKKINAAIISLKFYPGLYRHIIAHAKAFRSYGIKSALVLATEYKLVAGNPEFVHEWAWNKLDHKNRHSYVYQYSSLSLTDCKANA